MLTYTLPEKNKYYSLYQFIRDDILSGKIKAGERLPSKRTLAENLSVSVITVQTAYDQLLAEGYILSRERSGYYVAEMNADFFGRREISLGQEAAKKTYAADFVKGSAPAGLFPFSVWARLMRGVLADCGEHLLERVPCDGDPQLKSAIAAYLYRARGMAVNPRHVVIGAGAEYLYGVIVQLLGRNKVFAVENPGYGKIAAAYRLNGAECACACVKEEGICRDEAEKSGADVLHISPSHQFPTGAVTPAAERIKLIQWAISADKYIVEDDYDSEFRLAGKPLQTMHGLCPDRVIYMNTFSKTLAPSMRMGYMVLPPALYERYEKLFGNSANVVPLFEQKTLARLIGEGYFERHINRMKNYYKEVRADILSAIKALGVAHAVTDTGSGLHLTVKFPGAQSDAEIKARAAEKNINLRCLSDYLLAPRDDCGLTAVINYSAVTKEQIAQLRKKILF